MTATIMDNGLYIHIPFCLSKCGYCSFYSVTSHHLIPEFVKAVVREMTFNESSSRKRESGLYNIFPDYRLCGNDKDNYFFDGFDTIYFGGGTPSLLSIGQISEILDSAREVFEIDSQAEVTIEVNPGDVSLDYFLSLRSLGINRLNIGIQSFDDGVLNFLGRRHTAKEARSALEAARKAGFDNIGIDLIYGVFGQDRPMWLKTLKQAHSFAPEHLSCYQLSLDSKTALYNHYQRKGWALPAESDALDFFLTTSQFLQDAGYIHYEVSNFARSDSLKSRHNAKYWRHIPYLGLGPAAHSFDGSRRWWNFADTEMYLKAVFENKKPVEQSEELSTEQLALEALFLGLRTKEGIHLNQYKERFGLVLLDDKKKTIDELIKNKFVELKNGYLCPTLAGMAVADSLALI